HDAGDLGYRMIPVHPNDAGHTILGRPIRSHPWLNSDPELFVLFLSPDRVIASLRQWLLEGRTIPFSWLQPGAERDDVLEFLADANIPHSHGRCWVITVIENDLPCTNQLDAVTWFLQTIAQDGSECSRWRAFESGSEHMLDEPLEWVGDLYDLRDSDETIPHYIRSLQQEGETLNETAHRLSN
ncbi:MAG: CoA-binding protein, partial [Candidatus Thermoplasmatota archaeon]|nr:CoA-binding protein [Candidatus Thermoplasmatota archaeon]